MNREQEVLESLKRIIDPDLGQDIVSLGFMKDLTINHEGHVAFVVELPTSASPVKERLKAQSPETGAEHLQRREAAGLHHLEIEARGENAGAAGDDQCGLVLEGKIEMFIDDGRDLYLPYLDLFPYTP